MKKKEDVSGVEMGFWGKLVCVSDNYFFRRFFGGAFGLFLAKVVFLVVS